jgi:type IV pilus assembly protein PilV
MVKTTKSPAADDIVWNRYGFTVLEVIVAISILSVGLLALATMQATAIKGNDMAGNITGAVTLASAQMERLIALPYDDPLLEDKDGDGFGGLADSTAATADYPPVDRERYWVCWNVAVDDVLENTKTINVIVEWNDRGIRKRVLLQNIIPQV